MVRHLAIFHPARALRVEVAHTASGVKPGELGFEGTLLGSVAFCSPAKSSTFRGLMENPLVGKKLFSPNIPWQNAPLFSW